MATNYVVNKKAIAFLGVGQIKLNAHNGVLKNWNKLQNGALGPTRLLKSVSLLVSESFLWLSHHEKH